MSKATVIGGNVKMTGEEFLASLEQKAQEMKTRIVNTESDIPTGKTKYYVSNNGNDANDGLSPETAIASIEKMKQLPLQAGDIVLFERGGEYRGKFIAETPLITYSAYGTGAKPILNGSRRNFADKSLWKETDVKNVYACTENLSNVGIIAFDHTGEIGKYDEITGRMRISGAKDGFRDYPDLAGDLEFYCNLDTNVLYLYSDKGNPGERFSSIEIGESGNNIRVAASGITVDNLCFKYGGSHAVGSTTVTKLTVRNCIFCWIGGSILKGYAGGNLVRYGNAVEIGGCDGYIVRDNWMYQIYDTGVTHQTSGVDNVCHMTDIIYLDNLIEYCYWSIEFYNRKGNPEKYMKNVYMKGNFCRFGGYGWGCKGRESGTPMFCGSSMCDNVTNCVAEYNIFDRSLGRLIVLGNHEGNKKLKLRNNTYIQPRGAVLGDIYDQRYLFDDKVTENLQKLVGEEDPTVVYIEP